MREGFERAQQHENDAQYRVRNERRDVGLEVLVDVRRRDDRLNVDAAALQIVETIAGVLAALRVGDHAHAVVHRRRLEERAVVDALVAAHETARLQRRLREVHGRHVGRAVDHLDVDDVVVAAPLPLNEIVAWADNRL